MSYKRLQVGSITDEYNYVDPYMWTHSFEHSPSYAGPFPSLRSSPGLKSYK